MPAAFRAAVGADKTWSQIVAESAAPTPGQLDKTQSHQTPASADAPKKRTRAQADNLIAEKDKKKKA
jgi:hypothetical protein